MREVLVHIERQIEQGLLIRFNTGQYVVEYIQKLSRKRHKKKHKRLPIDIKDRFFSEVLPTVIFTKTFDAQVWTLKRKALYSLAYHCALFLCEPFSQERSYPIKSDIGGYRKILLTNQLLIFKETTDDDNCVVFTFGFLFRSFPPVVD